MERARVLSWIVLSLGLGATANVEAELLFDQMSASDTGIAYIGSAIEESCSGCESYAYDARGADDFVVPDGASWSITSVAAAVTSDLEYEVSFHQDAAGLPGAPITNDDAGNSCVFASVTASGASLALPSACKLASGTYWVSLKAVGGNAAQWGSTTTLSNGPAAWNPEGDAVSNEQDPKPLNPCIPNADALACTSGDADGDEVSNGRDDEPENACVPDESALACASGDTDEDGVSNGDDADPSDACVPDADALVCASGDADDDAVPNGDDPAPSDACNPVGCVEPGDGGSDADDGNDGGTTGADDDGESADDVDGGGGSGGCSVQPGSDGSHGADWLALFTWTWIVARRRRRAV